MDSYTKGWKGSTACVDGVMQVYISWNQLKTNMKMGYCKRIDYWSHTSNKAYSVILL